MKRIPVQLGLFGAPNQLDGYHLVAAHTRTRADGTEVFVGEHVRWNPLRLKVGRRAVRGTDRPDDDQVALFGG